MKKVLILLISILSVNAFSQSDKNAKQLLDKVYEKFNSYENIAIDFDYSLNNFKENIEQETSGKIVIKKDKYLLDFMGMKQLFDGEKLYTILEEDEEITISKKDDEDSFNPTKIVSLYKKGFSLKWDILQKTKKFNLRFVKLIPTNKKSNLKYILLGINTSNNNLQKMIEVDKSGTKTTFDITKIKTNQNIAKGKLSFNKAKYSDYLITDLN